MSLEMEERPPYVQFEQRALEDRAKSIESGKAEFRDVDIVMVTPHGSKDTFEDIAESWLEKQKQNAINKRIPESHYKHYVGLYDAFKEGKEEPVNGSAIKNWSVATPAQQKMILQANIRTVEDLAQANESALSAIGMGARNLKDKAIAWLESANSNGKATEKITDLESKLSDALNAIEKQAETIKNMADKIESYEKGSAENKSSTLSRQNRNQKI